MNEKENKENMKKGKEVKENRPCYQSLTSTYISPTHMPVEATQSLSLTTGWGDKTPDWMGTRGPDGDGTPDWLGMRDLVLGMRGPD